MTEGTEPTIAFPLRVEPRNPDPWWDVLCLTRDANENTIRRAYAIALLAMLKRHSAIPDNGDQQFERARLDVAHAEALRAKFKRWI